MLYMYTIYLGLITDCEHSAADRRSILSLPAPSRLGKHWREDRTDVKSGGWRGVLSKAVFWTRADYCTHELGVPVFDYPRPAQDPVS